MARLSKSAVAAFFVSGSRPNQSQFEDLIDSYQDFNDFLQEMATALATKTGVVAVSGSATSAHALLPLSLGGTGEGSLASAQNALNTGGFAVLASANQFTSENTFISSATGSAENPAINLDRRDAGLGGQNLGVVRFKGRDSLLASTTYAKIGGAIVSTSAGGETGRLQFTTTVSGASADRFIIAGGMYSLAASGGDHGIGTINVQEYYEEGQRLSTWTYGSQTATTTGTSVVLSTSIPAWATEVEIIFRGVGTDANSEPPIVELGHTAGTYITTGYDSIIAVVGGASVSEEDDTDGFYTSTIADWNANDTFDGIIRLVRWDIAEHIWQAAINGTEKTEPTYSTGHGEVDVTSALDSIRLTTPTGSDAFNAGEARVRWR